MKKIYIYSILAWIIFALIAIINGLIRDNILIKIMGLMTAYYFSTLILISLILFVMRIFFIRFKHNNTNLLIIGSWWVIATIFFEFILSRYVLGATWQNLFYNYNIFEGRIWLLVLLFIFVGPFLVGKGKDEVINNI